MANQDFNVLDPLGIAAAVKRQADQMALQAGMRQLPEIPKIKMPDPLGIFQGNNPLQNRPGYGRENRV